jgi:1-acyl-sn-glycerol-3-phosphate acyltransferase
MTGDTTRRVSPQAPALADDSRRADRPSLLARLLAAAIRALGRSFARIRIVGAENVPATGPLIVVANHLSNVDPAFLAAWLQPALGRPLRFLAKEQLFATPLAPLLRSLGTIPVRAGGRDVDAYRIARAALDRGDVIAIFPEGTRSTTGILGRAHHGAALLALRTGEAIVPVGIDGTDRLLGRGSWVPRFGTRVTIRVGRPFSLEHDPALERREAVVRATARIMSAISELLPEERRAAGA